MPKTVGVSILTNGQRLPALKRCLSSLIQNCYYRPLLIGVCDNHSTDGTAEWLKSPPEIYGVSWRNHRVVSDGGCAAGTNTAAWLVEDCEYVLHLESDFEHLPQELTGEDKMWMHRAIEFMDSGECDYLYLRRMVDECEMMDHWWSQWMAKIDEDRSPFLRCPEFWWSNNPHLRRNSAIMDAGCLPLNESIDGPKGTEGWSKPELQAPRPPNAWLYRMGLFVHDRPSREDKLKLMGCGRLGLYGSCCCKYGFFKDGQDAWCSLCEGDKGLEDMPNHEGRYREWLKRGTN